MKKIVIIGAGSMGSAFTVPCADNSNEVLSNAPEKLENYFVVPKVVE